MEPLKRAEALEMVQSLSKKLHEIEEGTKTSMQPPEIFNRLQNLEVHLEDCIEDIFMSFHKMYYNEEHKREMQGMPDDTKFAE